MTNLQTLTSTIPNFAQDIKANLTKIINDNNDVLTFKQILGAALACAYASEEKTIAISLRNETKSIIPAQEIPVIQGVVSLMAMNNTYHRFTNNISDKEYSKMPSGLEANLTKNHGIDANDFEIYCLAVSITNGCSLCIDHHSNQLLKNGATKEQIQMIAQIAAVVRGASRAIEIDEVI